MGTFMQLVALGFLVYNLTGSKWLLGLISAVQMGPSLLFSLPAGVLADRVPRRSMVLATQSVAVILAFALATLTALHRLQVWEIVVISTISGIAIAVESPARQAFVADLVGPDDLPNAIGWNSLVVNGARVIGPAVGGIAIGYVGVAPIFYYNSFSFLAMIAVLLLMKPVPAVPRGRRPLEDLREGLHFIANSPPIIIILLLTAAIATFVMNFNVFMPVIARDILHTGAQGLGWMWTAFGLGAVAGSMTVVTWSRASIGPRLLLVAGGVAALSTTALAATSSLTMTIVILLAVGWSTGAFFASANAALQHRVTAAVRGRVLSVYSMIFAGTTPIGSLFVAGVSSAVGAALALAMAGGVALLMAIILAPFAWRQLQPAVLPAPALAERIG